MSPELLDHTPRETAIPLEFPISSSMLSRPRHKQTKEEKPLKKSFEVTLPEGIHGSILKLVNNPNVWKAVHTVYEMEADLLRVIGVDGETAGKAVKKVQKDVEEITSGLHDPDRSKRHKARTQGLRLIHNANTLWDEIAPNGHLIDVPRKVGTGI